MGFFGEFKKFAMRGNVIDLAVGVIIGGAFGKITGSMVNDILMPPLGKLLGNVNFTDLFIQLGGEESFESLEKAKAAGVATINYGVFINHVIDFTLLAFAVFLMVTAINKLKDRESKEAPAPPPPPTTKECPECASSIPVKAKRCPCCTAQIPA